MFAKRCFRTFKQVRCVSKRTISNIKTNLEYPTIDIPNVTIPEFLQPYYEKYGKFVSIECGETGRKYTYEEVWLKSTKLSKILRAVLKLENDDVIAVILNNIPEYPIVYLGILKSNMIATLVSSHFTNNEIRNQLRDAGAKAVITTVDHVPVVKEALTTSLPIIAIKTTAGQTLPDQTIDFHDILTKNFDVPEISPCSCENIAAMPYSSGTTGLPKGVQITHKNLVANMLQNHHHAGYIKAEATDDFQEHLPTILPFSHIYGNRVVMLSSTLFGAKIITLPKYTKENFISLLDKYRSGTIFYFVPPILLFLTHERRIPKEYLARAKFVASGAAPLSKSDEDNFLRKFGNDIELGQGYGLTEVSGVALSLYPEQKQNKKPDSYQGSCGMCYPNTELKIVDPEDPNSTPLGPNCSGELLIRGPQVMKAYHNRPEETKAAITDDGWFRTGDIAHYNDDDFFFITDRIKELIKVKGNQVAPAELEAIIRTFPGVVDTAVIGVEDHISGEIPKAFVVKDGNKSDDFIRKLNEFVNEKVAKYKQLRGGIVLVDEIPKTTSGKILRKELKKLYT